MEYVCELLTPSMKSLGCKILAALCLLTFSSEIDGQDKKVFRRGLIFEGKIADPKVYSSIKGAKATMLVPAYEWEYGTRIFSKKTWAELGAEWNAYVASATKIADAIVEKMEPEWVRDKNKVIDYAIVKSDDPFLTSAMISKKFHPIFKDKLGENIHVIMPERGTIYLFPAEGGKLNGYGPAIVQRYKKSKAPVSVEVFLLTSEGYEVIGELGK